MNKLLFILKYIKYILITSFNNNSFTHAPFTNDFINEVFKNNYFNKQFAKISNLRKELSENKKAIEVEDLGTGSDKNRGKKQKVSTILKSSSVSTKTGELLFKLIKYFKPFSIIELGTSIGISTCYLSLAEERTNVHTIEGSNIKMNIAKTNFDKLEIKNVKTYIGDFSKILTTLLPKLNIVGMAFIDGNHTKEATIEYFYSLKKYITPNSLLVFDDIHWSKDMEKAWSVIKADHDVKITIDLFFFGLVFFRKECSKQNFIIHY